ncbi:MAG TPA: folylpolyglutamate synthase/dihydrofolate synthase family protein [Actinomycetota bacterium]|nr:folylpolyglutamate synthase/dihydrofolate synthase family protein [Actinomycetota bacterium]
MLFEEAFAELEARSESRIVPGLERIEALVELLGDPQDTHPSIHVAGTNGKTTTSRLVAALGCSHGLTTGLYTSPHLLSVTERFEVCGAPISGEAFAEQYERLLPVLELVDARGESVTYFEVLTALAFLWFADLPVGLGVYEVGMGGRWDATNVVAADVGVICPVALDHAELGSTVAEVAGEKAGIVKPGKVVICREQSPEAMAVIEARSKEVGARLLLEGRDFSLEERLQAIGGQSLTMRTPQATFEDVHLSLFGAHAARNAAAAVAAFEALLDRPLSDDAVREAFGNARSPGRLEVVARHPLLVLDGAHNPAGTEALVAALPDSFRWERLHLVVTVSADKDVAGILGPLASVADRAYAARNESARSADAALVAATLAQLEVRVETFGSVAAALRAARVSAGGDDLILVTGSLYTVADARRELEV